MARLPLLFLAAMDFAMDRLPLLFLALMNRFEPDQPAYDFGARKALVVAELPQHLVIVVG